MNQSWDEVLRPSFVNLESWDSIIFNFQWGALENASLRVYVGMMDDYGLCLMVIEHIAFDYYFFWVNRACVS